MSSIVKIQNLIIVCAVIFIKNKVVLFNQNCTLKRGLPHFPGVGVKYALSTFLGRF